jgi:hypothetical protein
MKNETKETVHKKEKKKDVFFVEDFFPIRFFIFIFPERYKN